ncbi:MAG: type II toxin-antitoxin system HicA family toxin [Spirochaetaceae bacterium]|nr:type II toxin-antitoxin system HicA family toxin [Spirochaetaceae bacterium]
MAVIYTCRELIKLIESDGWYLVHARRSHRKYRHQSKMGFVTVAHPISAPRVMVFLRHKVRDSVLRE